jgi:hypothetical protein
MVTIKELKEKSEKLTSLLDELQQALDAEKHRYIIKKEYDLGGMSVYSMKDTKTGELIVDKLERLLSGLHIRNIDQKEVFYI